MHLVHFVGSDLLIIVFVYSGEKICALFPVYIYVEVPSVLHVLLIILTKLLVFPEMERRMKRTRKMERESRTEREGEGERERGGERKRERGQALMSSPAAQMPLNKIFHNPAQIL